MKKNGFTLIELIATIVIMALILLLVMPAITALQNNNKDRPYEYYADSLIEAAKIYVTREGEDITSLGSSSFSGSGLETFDIPDTVTKINSYAFRYCNQLKSIELPTSLKGTSAISSNAFTSCTALEEITFGPGLSDSELGSWSLTVPANTFTNDANIKTINFRGSEVAFSKVTVKDTNLQKLVASGQITINFNYGM